MQTSRKIRHIEAAYLTTNSPAIDSHIYYSHNKNKWAQLSRWELRTEKEIQIHIQIKKNLINEYEKRNRPKNWFASSNGNVFSSGRQW